MDNVFQNRNGAQNEHPSREALLLMVDGEVSAKEAAQLETHLEACWPCRVKTKRIQETIADIIEFDEAALVPRLTPPHNWRNFDRRLHHLAAQSGDRSVWSRLSASLQRLLPLSRLAAIPDDLFVPVVRTAVAVLIVVLVTVLLIQLNREPQVSAEELLLKAAEAQAAQLRVTAQPVIHQRLQLRTLTATGKEEAVTWEIWKDVTNGRLVRVADGTKPSVAPARVSAPTQRDADVLANLGSVLGANRMDANEPLSITSYKSWRSSVPNLRDEVTRTTMPDGTNAFMLRTLARGAGATGQITESTLMIRAADWQPLVLRLMVPTANGQRTYEITAAISEVISLPQVDPKIFAASTPNSTAKPEPANSKTDGSSAEPEPPVRPPAAAPVASADLEVEVLRQLNQANALLGEQITLTRSPAGLLRVQGVVESNERKAELAAALAQFQNQSAIIIDIATVDEAVKSQQRTASRPQEVTAVSVTRNVLLVDAELRSYFSKRSLSGEQLEEQIRGFADRVLRHSFAARRHALALKQIAERFSADDLNKLDPPTAEKWRVMIKQHARACGDETAALRRELDTAFPSLAITVDSIGDIKSDVELARSGERLFGLAVANDEGVRRSFSLAPDNSGAAPIKTQQFWKTLITVEMLARRIGAQ